MTEHTDLDMRTPLWMKLLQLIGVVLLLLGVIARAGAGEFWGTWLALIGFLLFAAGRVIAWLRVG
jgi:Na+-driven multidrug efflux pump